VIILPARSAAAERVFRIHSTARDRNKNVMQCQSIFGSRERLRPARGDIDGADLLNYGAPF
jgi:hypothetical protein